MDKKNQDQVQAIYLAQANIFAYEARKSSKSWVPLCDSTVPISILYDNTRSIYRIISVDADIKEVVVNTTVIPELEFVKTTQKFGYWKDVASGRVFGIGFASEYEAEAFDECLRKVKQNIGPPSTNCQHHEPLQGQGDGHGQLKLPQISGGGGGGAGNIVQPSSKKINWDDYDQIGPTVLSMMNNTQHLGIHNSSRPSTYKVDLPTLRNGPANNNTSGGGGVGGSNGTGAIPKFYKNLDDIHRLPAPPAYHVQPFQYLPQSIRQYDGSMAPPNIPNNSIGNGPSPGTGHHPSLVPLAMTIPPGFCYQGPHQQTLTAASNTLPDSLLNMDKHGTNMIDLSTDKRDLIEEINRIKSENMKLTESLIESTCNAKKWELQVNSLREDNIQLVKSVADINTKMESLNKDCREYKEQSSRWKEHYQQAVTNAKEKGQNLKEAEDKLKCASADKMRIESVMKDLEEELKRQQMINKEAAANHMGQYTNKYFKELEEHYRKLLTDAQKRIEEVLRKDNDRKNVLRGVDTLFTGAIQGLINIHGQIRQAYEQQ